MADVVTAHDEAMAKMPHLVKLIGKLQPKVDSTNTGQTYQQAIDALKSSNKSMMLWMQGFGERFTADEMMKGKIVWLAEEEKKIEKLRKEIVSSIEKAEKLLEKE